jgi:hypothetical protein
MAVDENTRFQIASMSKFTAATAVGLFVDSGVNPRTGSTEQLSAPLARRPH